MAVKTFTTEVLTSADTNTYLANSGLVYVTSATVGTGVSTVTVSGAFSATYDSYKILYTGGVGSASHHLTLKLGSTATGYYGGLIFNTAALSTPPQGAIDTNNTAFTFAGGGTANYSLVTAELHNPFTANYTLINASNLSFANYGVFNGSLQNTTSYTAFTLIPSGATLTGGTITVYGYRKA